MPADGFVRRVLTHLITKLIVLGVSLLSRLSSAIRRIPRSKLVRACVALAAAAALVVPGPPAVAAHGGQVVRSGSARFEVLSPTLIRMEYAGDGVFTDAATFNAIGRAGFGRTA
jgi:hypothetical protein